MNRKTGRRFASILALMMPGFLAWTGPAVSVDQDAAVTTFKKCRVCHEIGQDAGNKVGPQLNGLNGRILGWLPDYKYSKAMRVAGEERREWNRESLDAFLTRPRAYIKGTKMVFAGIKDASERGNLVDWLLTIDSHGVEVDPQEHAMLGIEAAEIEGDPEYGEYLSGECVTCHRLSGEVDGIPAIVGWPRENFIHALYEYKQDVRENPVMQTVSKRLSDEEMAALAAYFGSLQAE